MEKYNNVIEGLPSIYGGEFRKVSVKQVRLPHPHRPQPDDVWLTNTTGSVIALISAYGGELPPDIQIWRENMWGGWVVDWSGELEQWLEELED